MSLSGTRRFSVRGNIVNIEENCYRQGEIIICDGKIASISFFPVSETHYILPGFIDSHIHIESSMVTPRNFALTAVKHGTTAVVTDPHEIANVCGKQGIEFMLKSAEKSSIRFFFGAPSCVPAVNFETSGASLNEHDVSELLQRKDIWFLSEMMNFPGVLNNDPNVVNKIKAAIDNKKPIDGHAPMLTGESLLKYSAAGISTDHECTSIDEAREKINAGMMIQIRQGSAAKDLNKLWPLIDESPECIMLCCDDLHPDDLLHSHINGTIQQLLSKGCNIYNVLRAACINPIKHYKLPLGQLRIDDSADFIIVDNLESLTCIANYQNGEDKLQLNKEFIKEQSINNFNRTPIIVEDINVEKLHAIAIQAIDGSLFTPKLKLDKPIKSIQIEQDLLKIIQVNRYNPTIKPSVGFIKGFDLKRGALASTIGHDNHNIIAIGTTDEALVYCVNELIKRKGGMIAYDVDNETTLPLPIGGIISDLDVDIVANYYASLNKKAYDMGCNLKAPFMTLSFMALIVIPELKLGERGLFDVQLFKYLVD